MAVQNQPVTITFKLEGSQQVEENIRRYIGRIKDVRPVGEALVDHYRQIMQRQFESSGAYLGHAWAALTQSTVNSKTSRGTIGNGILRDSMDLYYSMTAGGRGSVEMVTEDSVVLGSTISYLKYLDQGTRKMVARPVWGDKALFLHDMEREWSSLMADHIAGRPVKASGELGGGGSGTAERAERGARREESVLTRVLKEIEETVKRGHEKGTEWAERWSGGGGDTLGPGRGNSFGGY